MHLYATTLLLVLYESINATKAFGFDVLTNVNAWDIAWNSKS
jgi:hypothetical protein